MLHEIQAFKRKVGFWEEAKICLKGSINLHYDGIKTRNSKLSLKAYISTNILKRCLGHTSKFKLDIIAYNKLYLNIKDGFLVF